MTVSATARARASIAAGVVAGLLAALSTLGLVALIAGGLATPAQHPERTAQRDCDAPRCSRALLVPLAGGWLGALTHPAGSAPLTVSEHPLSIGVSPVLP